MKPLTFTVLMQRQQGGLQADYPPSPRPQPQPEPSGSLDIWSRTWISSGSLESSGANSPWSAASGALVEMEESHKSVLEISLRLQRSWASSGEGGHWCMQG